MHWVAFSLSTQHPLVNCSLSIKQTLGGLFSLSTEHPLGELCSLQISHWADTVNILCFLLLVSLERSLFYGGKDERNDPPSLPGCLESY